MLCVLQSRQVGVGGESGEILCRYCVSSKHLFALSCVKILFFYLCSICSCALIFGEMSFVTLFVLVYKWLHYCCVDVLHIVFHC